MWVIHNDCLMMLPDDVKSPPGSTPVKVPKDFESNLSAYKLVGTKVVRRTAAELGARKREIEEALLTPDEIKRVRQAIKDGIF